MKFSRFVLLPSLLILAVFTLASGQGAKYAVKPIEEAPPKELSDSIQKLLDSKALQLVEGDKVLAEIWLRKELPVNATAEQIKNGLTYREVKQTEIMAVIRFPQDFRDYRKQKVKAGVYTLRLGFQPQDGDHTGASETQDFLVAISASKDPKAEIFDAKHLAEASAQSIGTGHPAVFMLFPNNKPGAGANLEARPKDHWVLMTKQEATTEGKKTGASLGVGLTLVGAAD